MPQDYMNQEDFWSDLDSIKSMLDQEDQEAGNASWIPPQERRWEEGSASPSFDIPGTERRSAAPRQEVSQQPFFQPAFEEDRGYEDQSFDSGEFSEDPGYYQPEHHHHHSEEHSHSSHHSSHHHSSHAKRSRGTVITLYVVILLELAAIAGIGASWYLWMH